MQTDRSESAGSAGGPGTATRAALQGDSANPRQRLLAAALASGSRPRAHGGRSSRAHGSRLRLDGAKHVAMAARSTGPAAARVDRACNEGAPSERAATDDLASELRTLAHRATTVQAELLDALARFDEAEGWRADGAKNCVRWMCSELGIGRSLAYCQLAAARKLRELPIIATLFRNGELSWSKVQALTRIATPEDERALAIMALDLDANAVQQVCDEYRWGKSGTSADDDAERDRERFERRSLTWTRLPDGSLAFRTVLPPDMAANVIACLEHRESLEFAQENNAAWRAEGESSADADANKSADTFATHAAVEVGPKRTGAQRRADAFVAMAEASLSAAGENVSTADRFQVVVHVDAEALGEAAVDVASRGNGRRGHGACCEHGPAGKSGEPDTAAGSSTDLDDVGPAKRTQAPDDPLPLPIRAAIAGVGGISPSTARRLACDGSLVTVIMQNGEPLAVGRKTRRWSPATRRAVFARDAGCTFPGCGSTRNLDIHHVHGWALGGETSVASGTTLCRSCHTSVHDEGWRIRRVAGDVEPDRHPEATRLLHEADGRTRELTRVLDVRRARVRFERG